MEHGVFRPGLPQERNVGISIFPKGEEFLIRSLCLGRISRDNQCTAKFQSRQSADGLTPDGAG
jgi:hypothetical protein